MNTLKTFFLSILVVLSSHAFAVNDGDNDSLLFMKKFGGWTEEQIKAYEDSVIKVLTPPNKLIVRNDSTASRSSTQKTVRSTGGIVNSIVPNSVSISTSKGVGQIDIESGMTPTGARTYNVPIKAYSVEGVLNPQISLSYNSQQGDGIMGMGWDISGLSSITRGGNSVYYDNTTDGIRMNKNDSFWLDGIRLIVVNPSSSWIKYESEQGNIIAYGYVSGDVVKYFTVYYPDGRTATYGMTSNTANRITYPITSQTDLRGNTVTYSYIFQNNVYDISSISYNGTLISFSYQTSRPDPVTYSMGGVIMREERLLSSVACRFNSTLTGTYSLTYETKDNTSMLSTIGYAAGGVELNPLRFYYGTQNNTNGYSSSTSGSQTGYQAPDECVLVSGKFDPYEDSDGLICYPNYLPYWRNYRPGSTFTHTRNVFENQYTGDETIIVYTCLSSGFPLPMQLTTGTGFVDLLCADIYGETGQYSFQDDCIIKVNNEVSGSSDEVTFKVYRGNVVSVLSEAFTRTFDFPTVYTDQRGNKSIMPKYYFAGDFNGDGKRDILAVSAHNPFGETTHPSKCYIFDLVNNSILYEGHVFDYNVTFFSSEITDPDEVEQNTDKLFVIDHDGDGKNEICLVNTSGMHIYTFDSYGSVMNPRLVATYSTLTRSALANKRLIPTELNGDGLTDFLLSPSKQSTTTLTWNAYESKGDGSFYTYTMNGPNNSQYSHYVTQDVNGDGRCDLIHISLGSCQTYLTGDRSMTMTASVTLSSGTGISQIDINSYNHFPRLASLNSQGQVTMYSYNKNAQKDFLLTGMANSLGIIEKNEYLLTTEAGSGKYTHDNSMLFPYVCYTGPLAIMTETETFKGGSLFDNSSYSYENAVLHRKGLGFCGFSKVTATDKRGYGTVTTYSPTQFGVMTSEDSRFSNTQYHYTLNIAGNKIRKVNLTHQSITDKLRNITSNMTASYDTYGYPTSQTTYVGNSVITVNNTYLYNNSGTNGHYLGLLKERTIQKNHNGSTITEKGSVVSFNAMNLPLETRSYINGNQISKKVYTYDTSGNNLTESVTPYSSTTAQTTSWQYDSNKRKTSETDPMGLTSSCTYNNKGWIDTKTDHLGNTTTYTYDPFGRITGASLPDNTTTGTTYTWNSESGGARYTVTETGTGKPTRSVMYDALGREIRISEQLINSTVYTDKQYDSYGRLASVSQPYTSSATAYTTYGYDNYDRLTSTTEPSGRVTTKSYSGTSETTTVDGKSVTRTTDKLGYLNTVTDPAGTMSYHPSADGQPSYIEAPGNVTTTFTYDGYRRRTAMDDPSQGETSFEYDSMGNVIRETYADNRSVEYTYDSYGRLTGKSTAEQATTYTYNSYNQLVSASTDNGTSKTMTYDTLGRPLTVTEHAPDGKWLTKSLAYTSGRVSSATFTSQSGQLAVESYIYKNGHLQKITVGGTNIYDLVSTNVFNNPTQIKTGSIYRYNQYTGTGLLTSQQAKLSSGTVLQNRSYTFDPVTLNLLSRKDVSRNITENFSYDTLDRLLTYGSASVQYDVKGNITSKSDVGSYSYANTDKPYAVTEVNQTGSAVPARYQQVTYNSFWRPASVTENGYTASFVYNGEADRVRMRMRHNNSTTYTRYYIGGCYELDSTSTVSEKLYLGGDYYSAPAVLVKTPSGSSIYYILRDHLGSVTHVYNSANALVQELSYDAWGRLRNPVNHQVYAPGNEPVPFLGRGYTGHEHLREFGLINMNARLYDPALGRFLSPDPVVQAPESSQNYNRYSYCLNNPLVLKDRDGNFVFTILQGIFDTVKNVFKYGLNFSCYGYNKTIRSFKIDIGLFTGNLGQNINQHLRGASNAFLGNIMANVLNMAGAVENVTYLDGALAISTNIMGKSSAFTLGQYIIGPSNFTADWRDELYVHEFGHVRQGLLWGDLYLFAIGIPSALGSMGIGGDNMTRWFEIDASRRGAYHFDKYYGSGKKGYIKNDPNFFDKESYVTGDKSPYNNPRTGRDYGHAGNPLSGQKNSGADYLIPLLSILGFLAII